MFCPYRGRDSSFGIVTVYGLDGPGMELGGDEIFCIRPDRPCCPLDFPYNGYRVLSQRYSFRDVALTTHPYLVPRFKKMIELYLYSTSDLRGLFYAEPYPLPFLLHRSHLCSLFPLRKGYQFFSLLNCAIFLLFPSHLIVRCSSTIRKNVPTNRC